MTSTGNSHASDTVSGIEDTGNPLGTCNGAYWVKSTGNPCISSDEHSGVEGTGNPRRYSERICTKPCDDRLVFDVEGMMGHGGGSELSLRGDIMSTLQWR